MENIKEISYIIGFIQTDGCLTSATRNRGKVSIGISKRDKDILDAMVEYLDYNYSIKERIQNTNFKDNFESVCLTICDKKFRDFLINDVGMHYGKKSYTITIPKINYSEIDYWRGIIDGDGSLGLTSNNIPFLSLVTASEELKKEYLKFLYKITGKEKHINRNKRDNVFNIFLSNESAQKIIELLYYENCLCVNRKRKKADDVLNWERPIGRKKITFERKKWNKKEDEYIQIHTIEESVLYLKRTKKSIDIRKRRLKNDKSY